MKASLSANSLTKSYRGRRVVDSIDIDVNQGEVLGFLGPNGAGKTTTMRMLSGFIIPDIGNVNICGVDLLDHPIQAKTNIGYLPEGAPLYSDMKVIDFLRFAGRIRKLGTSKLNRHIDHVIDRIQLGSVQDERIDNLSKGFKRRVGIAQAIIHDPKVLIMDEPTDGLDPNQKREIRQLIGEMAEEKVIILSTHILEEVIAVCNRVMIIASGNVLVDQTPEELMHEYDGSLEAAFFNITQDKQSRT